MPRLKNLTTPVHDSLAATGYGSTGVLNRFGECAVNWAMFTLALSPQGDRT
jgi:hypothetical protein